MAKPDQEDASVMLAYVALDLVVVLVDISFLLPIMFFEVGFLILFGWGGDDD